MNITKSDLGEESKETGRVEAFSDGVFAIAITLLVLDIKVPHDLPDDISLLSVLLRQWPTYLAFLTSFATIGIMWINHHRMFKYIRRVDHWFLVLNALLLLGITIVPFPTSLVAEYVERREALTAVLIYTGMFIFIAIMFNAMWWYASGDNRLLAKNTDPEWKASISRQYRFGPFLYLAVFLIAFVSVGAAVALDAALALFFALPGSEERSR